MIDEHGDDGAVPLLRLVDIHKEFPIGPAIPGRPRKVLHAVKGVSLDVPRRRALGIVGESGCGKSTVAKMLVGLLRPTSGEILLDGEPLWTKRGHDDQARRRLQMVFQDPLGSLNPRKTVRQLIEAPLIGLRGMERTARRQRVDELMDLVGLRPEFLHRHAHEFSGGQCQRIGIARALATEAEIIVLDEPVSALDVSIQAQILELLEDLRERLDLTYVFISHDLSVVSHLCDEVAVMYFGELVETGRTDDVLRRPQHEYTRLLLDSIPGERLATYRRPAAS